MAESFLALEEPGAMVNMRRRPQCINHYWFHVVEPSNLS